MTRRNRSPIPAKTPVVHYSLPIVDKPQKESSSFRSISPMVLAGELRSPTRRLRLILIDCRYPFEYLGGHICGAINIYEVHELERKFFEFGAVRSTLEGVIPIFYCEYSQVRGPEMARCLRTIDMRYHQRNWSQLDFPEIYLLDRGYKRFWMDESLRDLCTPHSYVSMNTMAYRHILRQYTQHRRSKSVCAGMKASKRRQQIFSDHCFHQPRNGAKTPRRTLNFADD
ncbi:unnamed protein product [Caenorhabditis bovis]|uniref:protein-tyrosine-phosphatase n=1 Tax=Caenorhabditis bovis TaxID=2654633 RepID=A0A8S1F0L9_9PELO|nr:unnamed protein product [Caenorhabditis bovis]